VYVSSAKRSSEYDYLSNTRVTNEKKLEKVVVFARMHRRIGKDKEEREKSKACSG